MVFFLGGIQVQNPNGTLGFSTNPTNPTLLTFRMEQPYFDFPADRLQLAPNSAGTSAFGFTDPFNVFYAYFSSYYGNDYNRYGSSDCATLSVAPYYDLAGGSIPIYFNRDSFQIISAGKDQVFGVGSNLMIGTTFYGTQWSAGIGWSSPPGSDDFSNFSATNLGTGSQVQ
jgi:hypothetical protein